MRKRLVTVGDLVFDFLLNVQLPVLADAHQDSPILELEPGGACTTLLAARNMGLRDCRPGHSRRRHYRSLIENDAG